MSVPGSPPPEPGGPDEAGALVLAVDVGGTKLAAGAVDGHGRLVTRVQAPTEAHGDGDALFATLAGLTDLVRAHDDVAGRPIIACGVGSGGPMTLGGEAVSPLNITAWRGFPLRGRLAAHTGLPTYVDNDAKALALGEGWVGAAAGSTNFIAMVVSTGVGGGIVLDGRLLDGVGGNAGHIGHVVVEPEGRRCACGSHGCLEAEASGTAIRAITGRPAAEAGPEVVVRTGRLVGRAIAGVAVLLDLPLAVIAGSVALGYGEPFFAAAQREIDERACLSYAQATQVRPAGLGDAGPLIGAGAVGWRGWRQHDRRGADR